MNAPTKNHELPRALPEVEATALSCLIHCAEAWSLPWSESIFTSPTHKSVFAELAKIHAEDGKLPSVPALTAFFDERKILPPEEFTLLAFACDTPLRSVAEQYHGELSRVAQKRELVSALLRGVAEVKEGREPAEIVASLKRTVDATAALSKPREPGFTDLSPFFSGEFTQERPSVAEVMRGRFLFYAGRLNEVHAEPSVGKTNVLIAACCSVLRAGGRVLYIDPEDTPSGFANRALGLGGTVGGFGARCHYLHNPDPADFDAAIEWAREKKPSMVVLDGLAESLAAEGLDENAVGDILHFFRHRLRPFAELGAAVVIADHVVKSGEGRGRWARGSGAKLGRYDGVSFEAVLAEAYTPDRAGCLRLRVSKDRVGGVGSVGQTVWEVHFTPDDEKTSVEFRLPPAPGEFRPTAIMEKIKAHLTLYMGASKRDLRGLGKHDAVDRAIEILLAEGEIEARKVGQKLEFKMASEGVNS